MGLSTMYDSAFFTRSIWRACSAIVMKRWIIPIPPSRAIVIAISLSVTTSMLAETIGICSAIFFVKQVFVDKARRESTLEYCGTNKTSSYVRAVSVKIFIDAPLDLGRPNYNAVRFKTSIFETRVLEYHRFEYRRTYDSHSSDRYTMGRRRQRQSRRLSRGAGGLCGAL